MGDTSRLEELKRRVEADPASIAFATLAEEYRRAGRFDEAVDTSRAGLRFHPSYVSARVTLGRSLMELGEHGQAERELRVVLRTSPDNLAARRALGDLYWRQLELQKALEEFRAAATLAPGDDELNEIVETLTREVAEQGSADATNGYASAAAHDTATIETEGHRRPVVDALERFYRGILRVRSGRNGGSGLDEARPT
ncbi:MAG TPA: tetratricopeptide repeat protein [Vicinamibacterales bacterium]